MKLNLPANSSTLYKNLENPIVLFVTDRPNSGLSRSKIQTSEVSEDTSAH